MLIGLINIHGVKFVGLGSDTVVKLLLTVGLVLGLFVLSQVLGAVSRLVVRGRRREATGFWARQGVHLVTVILLVAGTLSIWFNSPGRLATVIGLVTAGLAFALQTVITAIAGYIVILRGKTFDVGDRIVMGGVRGDVIALGFIQTTIMEMGQPPAVQDAEPPMWVSSRQYTGRVVTVNNGQIFQEPVYNYTRDFPYIWDQMTISVPYGTDYEAAEHVMLEAVCRHTEDISKISQESMEVMERRYSITRPDLQPAVYYRITPGSLDLIVRFLLHVHGGHDVKDAMTREILKGFGQAGITIGPGAMDYEITKLPPLRIENGAGSDGSTGTSAERATGHS